MTYDDFNRFCAALPATSHVVQWGGSHVWKVGGKMFAVGGWDEAVPAFTFKVSPTVVRDLESAPRPAARALSRFARHELDSALCRTRPRRRRVVRLSRRIASARRARPERQEAARTGARVKPRFTLLRWRGYARTKSGTRAPAPRRGRARESSRDNSESRRSSRRGKPRTRRTSACPPCRS